MQYCRIGCAGARSIADQVLLNSRVRHVISLYSTVRVWNLAAFGLYCTSQVTQLDLQGNEIGTAGFIAVMDALRKNVNLERLNVADNAIDETLYSMEKLCSMIHLNRTLKHLNMKVLHRSFPGPANTIRLGLGVFLQFNERASARASLDDAT
jgi:D-ribose pyranose/furanose isomerase RbsD